MHQVHQRFTQPFAPLQIEGDLIFLGPLRLRIIERDYNWGDGYLVMCDGWQTLIFQKWYIVGRYFERFYRKLIIIAAVWGLADYQEWKVPTWKDVHILHWLAQRVSALRR